MKRLYEMVIELTSEKSEFLEESPRFVCVCESVCVYMCERRKVLTTSTSDTSAKVSSLLKLLFEMAL